VPRRGHARGECQDAWAADPDLGRFALSDGAGESYFPEVWAKLLVEAFLSVGIDGPLWEYHLPALQQRWYTHIGITQENEPLPYYLQHRFDQGAFATFLGLEVGVLGNDRLNGANHPPYTWHAAAVGDSCLFQVRGEELVAKFPVDQAADFGNAPWLVGSRSLGSHARKHQLACAGEMESHDRIWLMTDALSQWFLRQTEKDLKPWKQLDHLLTTPVPSVAFEKWIAYLRDSHQLKDDDVTLLAIYVNQEDG
jgi:hypothetical protein